MPGRRQHRLRRRSMHRLHRRYGRGGCWRGRSCRGRRQLRRAEADRRSLQRLRGNRKRCRCHSAGIGKYPGRHDGCRAAVGELLVRHLWRRVVRSPRRRDCLYFGDIGHADIGDIDVADINRIAGIVRPIHLARRKREPADRRPGFERCRRANAGILDKGDKRRRIDGLPSQSRRGAARCRAAQCHPRRAARQARPCKGGGRQGARRQQRFPPLSQDRLGRALRRRRGAGRRRRAL